MSPSSSSADGPRGRYAPTPSGLLHVGNARTALVAWASVRSRGGTFVWRVEDLDGPRTVEGAAEAAEEDLAWLGLDWDEGGLVFPQGGPHAPYVQSERLGLYRQALRKLAEMERLFPCRYSRKDLAEIATAPHDVTEGEDRQGPPPYPASLRPKNLEPGWLDRLEAEPDDAASEKPAALRCLVTSEPITFQDRVVGEVTERVDETVGDFVLARRDGVIAYQLAVVVDDIAMGIDDVVRGRDLLGSTARQIQLIEALAGERGGVRPAYAHVPLVVNADGEKLSKRDEGLTLRSLREAGVRPERLVGYMAWSLGLAEGPEAAMTAMTAGDFASRFTDEAWTTMGTEPHRLPADLLRRLGVAGPSP